MKRVVIYTRVSSSDQHTETQLCDLRPLAKARGYEIVGEYTDTISGAKAKRPGLDKLMSDARRGAFDIVMVWAFDRMARSVKHFHECAFAGIARNIRQTLVVGARFFAQQHGRLLVRQAHALQQQTFLR